MRRKVIQIADSTQLVSLPRKWAIRYGIKKGDELEIDEKGSLLIVKSDKSASHSSVEIDVTDLDRTSILYYMEILYRLGYDEVKVKFSKPQVEHYRLGKKENIITIVHYVASRLIGMEIVQQKENFVLLKSLETTTSKEFDVVMKRIFILVKDAGEDFISAIQSQKYSELSTLEEKHDSVAKFVSYGMRILNKTGTGDNRNVLLLYHIMNQIDKITDIIKYSGRELIDYHKPLHKDTIDILSDIHKSVEWYGELFFNFNNKKVKELYQNRDAVLKKLDARVGKLDGGEIRIIEYFRHILEFLVDITQARMGLEY